VNPHPLSTAQNWESTAFDSTKRLGRADAVYAELREPDRVAEAPPRSTLATRLEWRGYRVPEPIDLFVQRRLCRDRRYDEISSAPALGVRLVERLAHSWGGGGFAHRLIDP